MRAVRHIPPSKLLRLGAVALVSVLIGASSGVANAGTPTGGSSPAPANKPKPSRQVCQQQRAVQVTLTTESLTSALQSMPDLQFCKGTLKSKSAIAVSDRIRYQRIQGFGAAMTDSSAWLLMNQLRASTRAQVFDSLFGRFGIRLGFLRVPMGASFRRCVKRVSATTACSSSPIRGAPRLG
jgi:hypothetical protein